MHFTYLVGAGGIGVGSVKERGREGKRKGRGRRSREGNWEGGKRRKEIVTENISPHFRDMALS